MLVLSIILSLALLVMANLAVRIRGGWLGAFLSCGGAFSIGLLCIGLPLPPVALLFVFLLAAMLLWRPCQRRRWLFPLLSGLAASAAFGIAGWFAWKEVAGLQQEFPYQSLEEKLPTPQPALRPGALPDDSTQRLDRLEASLENFLSDYDTTNRRSLLRQLHEDTLGVFVTRPGFGASRMNRPYGYLLRRDLREEKMVPQPEPGTDSLWSPGEVRWERQASSKALDDVHEKSIKDFVNPLGFGYVKDRRHVAGFQPHQFSDVPTTAERWEVRHLDLVGLLMHEGPVAYVSDNLPRMDELRQAPTRPLDSFESAALERLRGGEDLVVGGTSEGLRMLGGIRSMKQCLQCHGGERGDLLGAFSYTLRRSKP